MKHTLRIWIIAILMLVCLMTVEAVGYCSSYCDLSGYYHESFYCHEPKSYCCGTSYIRGCCANRTYDITNFYPERYNCNSSTWMQVHWQVMITMTGSILLVLLFSACCCQCCRICTQRVEQAHRVHFNSTTSTNVTAIVSDADGNQYISDPADVAAAAADGGHVTIQMFNPESPYAFTPPEYDEQLPKDPPKYSDIFTSPGGGTINPCYVPDTPPPPFSELDESTGPPHPLADQGTGASDVTPTLPEVTDRLPEVMPTEPETVPVGPEVIQSSTTTDDTGRASTFIPRQSPEESISVIPMSVPDTDGFVDVDLSADDAGRPLTSHDAPRHVIQEEAREHCLGGDAHGEEGTG